MSENHYLQLVLKRRLLDVYRLTPPPPEENQEELRDFLEKQVNLGQNLLDVWSILEPGYRFSNINSPNKTEKQVFQTLKREHQRSEIEIFKSLSS